MALQNFRGSVPTDVAGRLEAGEPVYFLDTYYEYFLVTDRRVMGTRYGERTSFFSLTPINHITIPFEHVSSVDVQEHGFLNRYAYLVVKATSGQRVFTRCDPKKARDGALILQQAMRQRGH